MRVVLPLVVIGCGLLALPGLGRAVGRRLPPSEWVRLCVVALGSGVVVLEGALALGAMPTIVDAGRLEGPAAACRRLLGDLVPLGGAIGWSVVACAVILPVACGRRFRHCRRANLRQVVEPDLGDHRPLGRHELVVLPSPELLALSVAGPPAQVLVSRGLVDALSSAELDVVLRHESTHLDHRHESVLRLVMTVESALRPLPWVGASAAALRMGLERWADEEAAGAAPDDRAALRSALFRVVRAEIDPGVAWFSGADGVVERLDALASPRSSWNRRQRMCVYLPGVAVAVALALTGAQAMHVLVPECLAAHCMA